MQTLKHNVRWKVSLSNGETFYEEKGKFETLPNIKSPWQRLIEYTCNIGVTITSLSLYTLNSSHEEDDGLEFNLPSMGKNPKFRAFDMVEKPFDYEMCRKLGQDVIRSENAMDTVGKDDLFTVIIAYYEGYQLQLWVDENNTNKCWTLVVRE